MHQSDDFLWRVRYIHIMALKPLYEKLQILLLTEENAKTQRARLFPKSSQGWRQMDTRDAKLNIANFLLMDRRQQAEMLSRESAWRDSKADIDKVMLEFNSNVSVFTKFILPSISIDYILNRARSCFLKKSKNLFKKVRQQILEGGQHRFTFVSRHQVGMVVECRLRKRHSCPFKTILWKRSTCWRSLSPST